MLRVLRTGKDMHPARSREEKETEMTKKMLDSYRKLKREIRLLEYELSELRRTDRGIGNSVILNGKNGSKKPESVIGFDEKKYMRREAVLMKKKEEAAAVEKWIDSIEDVQARCIFKMYYIDGMNWEQVAMKAGYAGNPDYVRLHIRDDYIKNHLR